MIDWPLAELLPHAGDMILIDQVLAFDEEQIETRLTVRAGGLFNREDGSLPAWVGVELMAQSVAAFAGCHARVQGHEVVLGFLLGTRRFEMQRRTLPAGCRVAYPCATLAGRRQRHGRVRVSPYRPRHSCQRPPERVSTA